MKGNFTPVKSYPDTFEGYKEMKLDILSDFTVPITETLKSEINKRTTHTSLDNFCDYVINSFLENAKMKNESYFKLVLAYPGATTIKGDDAMRVVGHIGFYELLSKKLITPFGIADGITVYAL